MIKEIKQKLKGDENLKELLSGSIVTFVIKITGMLLGYVSLLFIAKQFEAEGTGIYSLLLNLLEALSIFCALGLNVAVLRFVGQYNETDKLVSNTATLFKFCIQLIWPITILVSLVIFFFSDSISQYIFNDSRYSEILNIGGIILPFFTINLINIEIIRGLKRIKISEYLRSVNRPLIIIILLALYFAGIKKLNPLNILALGVFATFLFSSIYILRYLGKNLRKKSELEFDKKEILTTSKSMMVTTIFSYLLLNSSNFFIAYFETSDQVGIFNVCLKLSNLIGLVLIVINTIAGPKFAELYWNNKKEELKRVLAQSAKIVFWLSMVLALFLLCFSKQVLGLFGKEFIVGNFALFFLIIGQFVNAMTGSVGIFLNMTGHHKAVRNIIVLTTITVLLGYIIFIPMYGIDGAAVVAMVGVVLNNVLAVIFAYKKLNIMTFYIPFVNKKLMNRG